MMSIRELNKLLKACERYIDVANSHGDDITIQAVTNCDIGVATVRFCGHLGETWEKELWIGDNEEFHIEDPKTRESILNYAYEFGWSKEEVEYIKFGYKDEVQEAFLVDQGVLLSEGDPYFEEYAVVYDEKYGYEDEGQYYLKDKQKAIKDAKEYVEKGVEKTYAVVSKTKLPVNFDFDEGYVEDEKYLLEDVIYSAAKFNGEVVENFLNETADKMKEKK